MSGSKCSFISPPREKALRKIIKQSKKLQSHLRERSGQEVESVKRAEEIILYWYANNYDHFHTS